MPKLFGIKIDSIMFYLLYFVILYYAIVDKNEMVELKHELFARRQFLRSRIDYNLNAIADMRKDVDLYVDKLGPKAGQIMTIVNRVDELNKNLGLL